MSTYRYRDTAGGINGAYGVLTADTFTATNLTAGTATLANVTVTVATVGSLGVLGNLTVNGISTQAQINCTGVATGILACTDLNCSGTASFGGAEAVSAQGAHIQWSRAGDGATYIANQKGAGGGGTWIGDVTVGNVFAGGLYVVTASPATATVICTAGRLEVSGTSSNGAIPAAVGYQVVNDATSVTQRLRCSPAGFGLIDFYEDAVVSGRLGYNSVDDSMIVANFVGGPCNYSGQTVATALPAIPVGYLGNIQGTSSPFAQTNILRQTSGLINWNPVGVKVSLTVPVGHWIMHCYAYVGSADAGTLICQLNVDGSPLQIFRKSLLVTQDGQVMSITVPIDVISDTAVISIETTSGSSTGAASQFFLAAQRIG